MASGRPLLLLIGGGSACEGLTSAMDPSTA